MNLSEIALLITALSGLLLGLYNAWVTRQQNKEQAKNEEERQKRQDALDKSKQEFDQNNQLMEQQRQLINTLQGLLTERDSTIRNMQMSIDSVNLRLDQYIKKNAPTDVEKEEATKLLKLHVKEAKANLIRDEKFALKLDAIKPIDWR